MPHVSIARSALRELRERIARYKYPTGIRIIGPLEEDCRAPESVEDAWLIEKLYGPPQRWVLTMVPLDELEEKTVEPGESFHVEDVSGISVGILTSKTVQRLHIELRGTRFVRTTEAIESFRSWTPPGRCNGRSPAVSRPPVTATSSSARMTASHFCASSLTSSSTFTGSRSRAHPGKRLPRLSGLRPTPVPTVFGPAMRESMWSTSAGERFAGLASTPTLPS